MITRRHVLKNLAFVTGTVALAPSLIRAQTPAAPTNPAPAAEGVFKLPPLGYDYDALEPYIDAETMKIHHDKHHAAYVSKLNLAIAGAPGLEKKSIEEILSNLDAVPEAVRKDIRNQGGGHANHSLFWQTLKKNENGKPAGELAKAIDTSFGSFDKFQETSPPPLPKFSAADGPGCSGKTISSPSIPRPIRTASIPRAPCRFSGSTCGSMPTTSSIKTAARSTSKPSRT